MNIKILPDEYWWAGIVNEGTRMPLGVEDRAVVDFRNVKTPNQASPLLLSSAGRYLWSDSPYTAVFENGEIRTDAPVEQKEGFGTLKGAYLAAMKAHFPFAGEEVEPLFFSRPQYNTWIELMYDQTQEGILRYAEGILEHGLPAGILMIDEGWAEDYGRFSFRAGAFPDPKGMMERLHEMGFRLMLWITPYISPDSAAFRELEPKGYLLKDASGETAVRRWWNGLSAVLDLTNPDCEAWFEGRLRGMMEEYGVDDFKFDGGDPEMYRDDDRTFRPASAWEQTRIYGLFGKRFALNEFRAGWRLGGQPLVMRLADKLHSWEENGLNTLIPNSLIQSLSGYAYHCPDMIGGGEYQSFRENASHLDTELVVRYAQAAALCPMMQFSAAPWRILDEAQFAIVKQAALLHERFGPYIARLAKEAARTGEPILRHMAYAFPGQGMERVSDQFMLGAEILAAPVLKKGERSRMVKLPEGSWEDMEGRPWEGGRTVSVDAPLEKLVWFRKTGGR